MIAGFLCICASRCQPSEQRKIRDTMKLEAFKKDLQKREKHDSTDSV